MPKTNEIKLFKIATEINIGKDAIVQFLQSKGFQIENKATAVLTEEMVALVYDKFKKEKKAAEKQREKIEKHKQIKKPVEKPAVTVEKEIIEVAPKKVTKEKEEVKTIEIPPIIKEEVPQKIEIIETKPKEEKVEPKIIEKEEKEIKIEKIPTETKEKIVTPEEIVKTKQQELELTDKLPQVEQVSPAEKLIETQIEKEIQQKEQVAETEIIDKIQKIEEQVEEKIPEPIVEHKEPEHEAFETKELLEEKKGKKHRRRRKIAEVEIEEDQAKTKIKGLKIIGRIDIQQEKVREKGIKGDTRIPIEEDEDVEYKKISKFKKRQKIKLGKEKLLTLKEKPLDKKKKRKKSLKEQFTEEEINRAIKRTLSGIDEAPLSAIRSKIRQKKKLEREEKELKRMEEEERESRILKLPEFVTTDDLSKIMNVPANEIILKCLNLGLMVTLNQRLDRDTITLIADDYGYEVQFLDEKELQIEDEAEDPPESLQPRPPIVTIMGHVDHGKTSLLDYIRESNVVAGEAGGITQHIGAYKVELPNNKFITFLDTPGHEAFTAMRARGTQVTDIVVLVVAADDSVMPQTVEAISHAQAAGVPIIVAINKIDKPDAKPDRIRQQLADRNILVEDWGGKYQCVEISAKMGTNVDLLLEKILLEAEMLDLKANPNRKAKGTIIEAKKDKGLGPVATVIIQKGTLKIGDPFVAGTQYGRVRALYDERGNRLQSAGPATPVRVVGFEGLPEAGDILTVTNSEAEARERANRHQKIKREHEFKKIHHITLDDVSKQIKLGEVKELNLIIKGDVAGSVEALSDSLQKLSMDEVRVSILHQGVGNITESDVMLAMASRAIIIGFQTGITPQARKLAENESVDIRMYNIIYDCINEIKLALEGLLTPITKEDVTATVEVRKIFKVSKIGTIAGCYVASGKINRNDRVRVLRDGLPIYNGSIHSLKRNKDDVREVDAGYECGIVLEGFQDIEVGDIIEGFKIVEIKKTLS